MPKIDIDADVLNQAIQGDRSALEILTRRWWPSIRRWAYIELGDKALAEDACQEAMIRLVRFIHRYDDQYTFQSWLRTIVRNCCKDARKSNSRHLHSALKEVAQPHRLERAVDIRHRASEACAAFHRLSPRQREIIALCDLQGHSPTEVAALLGLAPGSVRTQLHAARRSLRQHLSDPAIIDLLRDA